MGLFRRRTDPAELERLHAEIASLRQTLEQQGSWVFTLESRLNALGDPPPAPSVDIETGATQTSAQPHDCAVAGKVLRDGQVRLAAEQARYQIAFRQDLARLADQLKRKG